MNTTTGKIRFFNLAKNMALQSEYGKFRHGAVLAKGGIALNAGCNRDRPTSFGSRFRHRSKGNATVHAELAAILNVPRSQTENADIYVVRIGAYEDLRNSKPCPMCEAAMRYVGIKRVFYSNDGGEFEVMKL